MDGDEFYPVFHSMNTMWVVLPSTTVIKSSKTVITDLRLEIKQSTLNLYRSHLFLTCYLLQYMLWVGFAKKFVSMSKVPGINYIIYRAVESIPSANI